MFVVDHIQILGLACWLQTAALNWPLPHTKVNQMADGNVTTLNDTEMGNLITLGAVGGSCWITFRTNETCVQHIGHSSQSS